MIVHLQSAYDRVHYFRYDRRLKVSASGYYLKEHRGVQLHIRE